MTQGYGTEYEIFILKGIAKRICQKYQIKSALQFPQNNLLGKATIFPLFKGKREPDLVWSFCDFENQKNSGQFLRQVSNKSCRYVLIITQNHLNPGVIIHLFYHFLIRRKWDHGGFSKMSYRSVQKAVRSGSGLKMVEIGAFDIPWFILDVYETGRYLRHLPVLKEGIKEIKESPFEKLSLFLKLILGHHHFLLLEKVSS